MAINKTISTDFGIDLEHHVTFNIEIWRASSQLAFKLKGFPTAAQYNQGKNSVKNEDYVFDFSVLPQSVLTKIIELKDTIEQEMINNLPEWQGGTRVNDDGTPITTTTTTTVI